MADAEGVQQELQDYLHKKGINTLFINLVESLLLTKPENPILHIIQYLQANYPDDAAPPHKKDAPHVRGGDNNPASNRHHPNHQCACMFTCWMSTDKESWDLICVGADHSDESDSEDDDDGDALSEIQEKVVAPKPIVKGRRTSVSAETIDPSRYSVLVWRTVSTSR